MSDSETTTTEAIDRVWEMMDDIRVCMLVTKDGLTLRARPMHAQPSREEGCVWFLSDRRGHKDEELQRDPQAALAFADTSGNDFLSVSGEAEILHDPAKLDALWSDSAKAFWPQGKSDPSIQVLRFLPESAEYWDGPGSLMVSLKLAAARLTGSTPDLGEHRKVPLD